MLFILFPIYVVLNIVNCHFLTNLHGKQHNNILLRNIGPYSRGNPNYNTTTVKFIENISLVSIGWKILEFVV